MTDNNELPAIFQVPKKTVSMSSLAPDVEQQAAAVISELSEKYPAWAMADVLNLKRLFNDAHSIAGDARAKLIKDELYRVSHDIKGQGSTFGYPLMTDVAASLCAYIKSHEAFEHNDMQIIKQHVDILGMILSEKLAGAGGPKGDALREKIKKIMG